MKVSPALVSSLFATLLAFMPAATSSATAAAPTVRVENVRRVFHNGEHNAFTDIVRWKGKFWLSFRSCPDGHNVFSSASTIVLSSDDAKTWRQVHRFAVTNRDTRDPHLLVFKDKLFVITGATYAPENPAARRGVNDHQGFAAWTADGAKWQGPQRLEGTYGHYVWRAAAYGGKAYLTGRRGGGGGDGMTDTGGASAIRESALLESDDGLRWRFVSVIQKRQGNETALSFDSKGVLTALSRKISPPESGLTVSDLSRSYPPYEEWTRQELPKFIPGPLIAHWGDRVLIGGRQSGRTQLWWLIDDELVPCAVMPSSAENGYAGFVALDERRGLLSYYSSHEKGPGGKSMTAIYIADLVIDN